MMNMPSDNIFETELKPAFPLRWVVIGIVSLVTLVLFATSLPIMSQTLSGAQPKAYWYISRSSSFVGFGLITLSMLFGMMISSKRKNPTWLGRLAWFELHQHTSLLGLAFVFVHVLVLLGDQYLHFTLSQLFIPFANREYEPLWVGVGQLAFYVLLLVTLSFYARSRIGHRAWRIIHYASFGLYWMIVLHSVMSGTDSKTLLASAVMALSSFAIIGFTIYRVVAGLANSQPALGAK